MMDDSDEAVWARVTTGDARAFGVIWDRHRARVFRHLRAGAPSADAEDLTAMTFLELWRRRRAVRFVDGSLLPWLIVTARNVARNASRSARRYERFLASLPAPVPVDGPEKRVDLDERTAAVRAALTHAKPADADLLAMTALEGFTVAEAAAVLGLSESAAKMRLSRLRTRLRGVAASHPTIEAAEGGT